MRLVTDGEGETICLCLSEIVAENPVRKDEEGEKKPNFVNTFSPGIGGRHPGKDEQLLR